MDKYENKCEAKGARQAVAVLAPFASRLAPAVVLVGFMGCGKSSVARALAARLKCDATDLDHLIEAREKSSIAEIFSGRGEEEFRKIETEVLRLALDDQNASRIIATGGGVVTRAENRTLLKQAAQGGVLVVYLESASHVLAQRIRRQPGLRPLIDGKRVLSLTETQKRVEELLEIRAPLYREAANFVIKTEALWPDEIARRIELEINAPANHRS
jgi:shikimate kinase